MARRRLPTLSSLRAFEAAARHGSFKLGAHELGVTPTSISHQVKSLEDQLAVKLFERFNRRVELTRAGEHYARALTSAFDGIDGATRALAAMAGCEAAPERLVIACNPGFIDCWLRARLADFQAHHPGIWPEIISTDAIREALARGAQLGIHHGQRLQGVDCELLTDTRFFPVCSPDLLQGEHALRSPADLSRHTLLHEGSTSHWGAWLRAAGAPADVNWRAGPVFHSSVLVIETAVAGQGVGLGDELIAGDHLQAGRLVKPFAATPTSSEASYLVVPDAGAGMAPAARVFRDWLVGQIDVFRPLMTQIRRHEPFVAPAAR